jgi:hypothetical protein
MLKKAFFNSISSIKEPATELKLLILRTCWNKILKELVKDDCGLPSVSVEAQHIVHVQSSESKELTGIQLSDTEEVFLPYTAFTEDLE